MGTLRRTNGGWRYQSSRRAPSGVVAATRDYLAKNRYSPPPGSSQYVSLPNGTIEIKAAWRPLNPSELASGIFHAQRVRFDERTGATAYCYRNANWGVVALHIIQKISSAPYFIYASFEQADKSADCGWNSGPGRRREPFVSSPPDADYAPSVPHRPEPAAADLAAANFR